MQPKFAKGTRIKLVRIPAGAFSLRNYRTKAGNIPLGTEGYVITTRDSNPREYLVKLDGHRNPRHVEEGWIEQA